MLVYYKLFKQQKEFMIHKLMLSLICWDDRIAYKHVICMIAGAYSQNKTVDIHLLPFIWEAEKIALIRKGTNKLSWEITK